jgi:hypothetical protein
MLNGRTVLKKQFSTAWRNYQSLRKIMRNEARCPSRVLRCQEYSSTETAVRRRFSHS